MLFSADEKDRDSIFTTVTIIWKPDLFEAVYMEASQPGYTRELNLALPRPILLRVYSIFFEAGWLAKTKHWLTAINIII
jgi:hypothetical protein